MRHIPRFYCPDLTLASQQTVVLPEMAAHHARTVLRLKEGANVRLFNPRDGEWHGTCTFPDRRTVLVSLQDQLDRSDPLRAIWLVLAPLKNKDSMDNALRHAVELGVTRIIFVQTAYTQQSKLNAERLQQQAVDAVQQCGRLSVPEIVLPQPLKTVLQKDLSEAVVLACLEGEDVPPLAKVVAGLNDKPLALLVGPEGGFSPDEKALLIREKPDLYPVSLGSLILRSDTAVAAGLAILSLHTA